MNCTGDLHNRLASARGTIYFGESTSFCGDYISDLPTPDVANIGRVFREECDHETAW